jgi:hypothetical protein
MSARKRLDEGTHLLQVALAVRRGRVRAGQAGGDHVRVRLVVAPRRGPASGRGEVDVGRVPVERAVDGSTTTNNAASPVLDVCSQVSALWSMVLRRYVPLHHQKWLVSSNMDSNRLGWEMSVGPGFKSHQHLRRDVELGVVRPSRPRSLVRAAGDANRWRATLKQDRVLTGLREPVGGNDTAVACTDDNIVVRL